MEKTIKLPDVFFDDPRLGMTIAGRMFVRVGVYVGYLVWIAAAGIFVLSDLGWLRAVGVFFVLVLLDQLVHLGHADRQIGEFPRRGRANLAKYMRPRAFAVIERAFDKSLLMRSDLYLEIARQCVGYPEIKEGLRRLDVDVREFKQKLDETLAAGPVQQQVVYGTGAARPAAGKAGAETETSPKSKLREGTGSLALEAARQAADADHRFIEVSDVFSALPVMNDDASKRIFGIFEIEAGDLSRALILTHLQHGAGLRRIPTALGGFVLGTDVRIRHRVMNRAWTARPTPTLDKYSSDFTDLARQHRVGFLIGHEKEFERMVETLARPVNPNVLLVGEAGIGKETLVTHLAFRLVKDDVPQALFDKRLVALELSNLVAGAEPGELNARLRKIVEEILLAGNVILYIPDVHNLVRTSGTAFMSAADAIMPVIMHNAFPVVGATYPKEFKESIEPRSDFVGAFEVIRVEEITTGEAEKILAYDAALLERQFKVVVSFGAIKKAVYLAKRYFTNKFLPSSAEELLKSALVEAQHRGEKYLGSDIVVSAAEEKTNVPIGEAGEEEKKKLLNLEAIIHERLIDQEEAVKAVADALREYRSGLSRPGGPIASFLFVGPTGVGKTELAKQLAKAQFGSEKAMIRFDMTEYQDKTSFYRFIGSPDGKVSGALTEAVLQKPYCLILLDEFEKAFPDILTLFLQVLDDGRLTDNTGRLVGFENTIIIATSNAHSDIINESLNKGESMAQIAEYLKSRLVDVFKPELLNRFSKIVVFKNLEPRELEKVAFLNLADLSGLVGDKGVTLEFGEDAVREVAKLGFDPAYGARPLRRVIDEKIRAPLAEAILEGKVKRGSKMKLVFENGEFKFTETK